ncbi:MAG: hypothetical protein V4441_08985 [Pseudomonadota bacterium]
MSKLESNIGQIHNFPSGRAVMAAALIAVVASGLAACSATPDAVKPAAIYGEGGTVPTPEGTKGFPQLADTPDQRPASTSAADRKVIADELEKDRAAAEGKDSALRAGEPGSSVPKPSSARLAEIDKAAASATLTASVTPPPAPVPAPAPVAAVAPAPAPEPQKVAAAEPAPAQKLATPYVAPNVPSEPEPEPQKVAAAEPAPVQKLATPYVAPNLPSEPAKVVQPVPVASADATAGTVALLDKINEPAPAAEMQMASAEPVSDPVASPVAAPAIVNGIIPMPPRGGHKSLAAVMSKPELDEDGDESVTEKAEPENVPDPNAEAPVTAAPTTKVEVSKPTQAPTAP